MNKLDDSIELQTNVKVCNKCGQKYKQDKSDLYWDSQLQAFLIVFGYGSKHDLEQWKFCLCDDCIDKIVKSFIVPIQVEECII